MLSCAFDRRFAVFLCSALLLAGPALAETVRGNGVIRTQARTASGFTGIALALPARVELKQGASDSVTVEADENLLALIETKVDGNSLEIRPVRENLQLESRAIKVIVQARQVESLAISGTGSIMADALKTRRLKLDIGGSGGIDIRQLDTEQLEADIGGSGSIVAHALKARRLKLDIGGSGGIDLRQLDTEQLEVDIGGSGDVKLAGVARRASVAIGGSGNVDALSLVADKAEVSVAGSGDATIGVRSSLQATVTGSGDIRYRGDPSVSQTSVGSGRIRRIGALGH